MKGKMKCLWVAALIIAAGNYSNAQTNKIIDLKERVVSFTNLQGKSYSEVLLAHGDLDGIIYRLKNDGGGGFVSYTNIPIPVLERWGIPTNRVELAQKRAIQSLKDQQERKKIMRF